MATSFNMEVNRYTGGMFNTSVEFDARMNPTLLDDLLREGILSLHLLGESKSNAEADWDFLVKKEYGVIPHKKFWGLPQGVMWVALKQYDQVKNIGKVSADSVDASAITPTNITPGRIHDLVRYTKFYASKRFLVLYQGLRNTEEMEDIVAIQLAAMLTVPTRMTSKELHNEYWVNGLKRSLYDGPDWYPITVQVKTRVRKYTIII